MYPGGVVHLGHGLDKTPVEVALHDRIFDAPDEVPGGINFRPVLTAEITPSRGEMTIGTAEFVAEVPLNRRG